MDDSEKSRVRDLEPGRVERPLAATPPVRRTVQRGSAPRDPFVRAENEDDDGYDPYSDRRPEPEPLFERDPWG